MLRGLPIVNHETRMTLATVMMIILSSARRRHVWFVWPGFQKFLNFGVFCQEESGGAPFDLPRPIRSIRQHPETR